MPDFHGRVNLEYGSYAPGAAQVFITPIELDKLWKGDSRCYLLLVGGDVADYQSMLGSSRMYQVATSGGKFLFSNQPLAAVTSSTHTPD